MQRRAVVVMVGLMGCDGVDRGESPSTEHRTRPTNPPKGVSPGEVTQPDLQQAGELNARSANLGRLFVAKDGSCFVRLPSETPLPPGAMGETQAVPCTDEMKHPSFVTCGYGVITRSEADECSCEPWAGNPPPPSMTVDCPGDPEAPAAPDNSAG